MELNRVHTVDEIEEPIDDGEVLRYLGYPQGQLPAARLRATIEHWIQEAAACATPRAAYLVIPIEDIGRRHLRLQTVDQLVEFQGAIGEFLGPSQWVTAFIATAGSDIVDLASRLMSQGDALAAMVVNSVGAERAEAAEGAVMGIVRTWGESEGMNPTLPYSPGYCGMQLAQQQNLFALFGEQTVGVTLTPDCLMQPLKSVSGLIGLGPADQIVPHASPCDRCELYSCAMRRSS